MPGDDWTTLTTQLIPKAQVALDHLCELTELNRHDVINRAIQFYEFAETSTHPLGSYLAVVDKDGNIDRVKWT